MPSMRKTFHHARRLYNKHVHHHVKHGAKTAAKWAVTAAANRIVDSTNRHAHRVMQQLRTPPRTPTRSSTRTTTVGTSLSKHWADARAEGASQHNDTSQTHAVIPLRPAKPLGKVGGGMTYRDVSSARYADANVGRQGVYEMNPIFTKSQLTSTPQPGATRGVWYVNPWDANPNQKMTGGGIVATGYNPSSTGANGYQRDYCYFHNVELLYDIASFTTVSQHIDFALWLCKKSSVPIIAPYPASIKGPATLWTEGLASQSMGVIPAVQPTNNAAAPVAGYVDRNMFGESPYGNTYLKKYFKPIYRKTFILQAGDNKILNLKIKFNKMVDMYTTLQTQSECIPGLTIIPMMIVRPSVIKHGEEGSFSADVGVTDLGAVESIKVDFKYPIQTERLQQNYITDRLVNHVLSARDELVDDKDTAAPVVGL